MALFTFHILVGFWSDSSEVSDIAVKCFARSARVASSLCVPAVQAAMQLGYRIRRGFYTQRKSRDTQMPAPSQAGERSESFGLAWGLASGIFKLYQFTSSYLKFYFKYLGVSKGGVSLSCL